MLLSFILFSSLNLNLYSEESPYSLEVIVIPPGNEISYKDPRELLLTLAGAPRALFLLPFSSQQERLKEYFKSNWPYLNILVPKTPSAEKFISDEKVYFQVGHTMVRLKGPEEFHFFGATDLNPQAEADLIFTQKIGFAFAWQGVPGRLHDADLANYSLQLAFSLRRKPAILRFDVSEATFRRLVSFYEELSAAIQTMPFALGARPRYREGFGCSSVGEAFIDIGGLLNESHRQKWKRKILVPTELIGSQAENIQIEVADVVNRKLGLRWAKKAEPHRELNFVEVEKIYQWARRLFLEDRDFLPPYWDNYDDWVRAKRKEGFNYAIHINAQHYPTPDEPLFYER